MLPFNVEAHIEEEYQTHLFKCSHIKERSVVSLLMREITEEQIDIR